MDTRTCGKNESMPENENGYLDHNYCEKYGSGVVFDDRYIFKQNRESIETAVKQEWSPSSSPSSSCPRPQVDGYRLAELAEAFSGKTVCFFGDSLTQNMAMSLMFEASARPSDAAGPTGFKKEYGSMKINLRKHLTLYHYEKIGDGALYKNQWFLRPYLSPSLKIIAECDVITLNTALFWGVPSFGKMEDFNGTIVELRDGQLLHEDVYPRFVLHLLNALNLRVKSDSLNFPGLKPGAVVFWRSNPVKHSEYGVPFQPVPDHPLVVDAFSSTNISSVKMLNVTSMTKGFPRAHCSPSDRLHLCIPGSLGLTMNLQLARQVLTAERGP